jgi:mannosyltransferase
MTVSARLRDQWQLGVVMLLALVVRLPTLGSQSFWRDEAVTVKLLHKSFGGMLSALPESESTPPLYYVIAWVWARAFGFGEVGLRALSVVMGVLTVAIIYRAAELAISRRAAVIAGLLAAVNPFLVWYSQEARAYSLFILLGSWSFLWFLRALREPTRRNLVIWSVISALAVAAHYFACFLILAEAIWLLAVLPQRREVALACVAWIATGLALAPLALAQSGKTSWISESGSLPLRLKESVKNFLVGINPPFQPWALLVTGLLAVLALYLLQRAKGPSRRLVFAAGAVGLIALGLTAVADAAGFRYLNGRNVSVDFVALLLPVAAGLALARTRVGLVAAAVLVIVSAAIVTKVYLDPKYQKDNWRLALEMVGTSREPRAIVSQRGLTPDLIDVYGDDMKEFPASGAPVSELALVDVPRSVGAAPRVPGFRLSSERTNREIAVYLYRAPTPVGLTREKLADVGPKPATGQAFTVLQLPSGSS